MSNNEQKLELINITWRTLRASIDTRGGREINRATNERPYTISDRIHPLTRWPPQSRWPSDIYSNNAELHRSVARERIFVTCKSFTYIGFNSIWVVRRRRDLNSRIKTLEVAGPTIFNASSISQYSNDSSFFFIIPNRTQKYNKNNVNIWYYFEHLFIPFILLRNSLRCIFKWIKYHYWSVNKAI